MAEKSLIESVRAFFSAADTIVAVKEERFPYVIKGEVPKMLLSEIDEVLKKRAGSAYIFQYGHNREYHLSFSKRVPKTMRQRIRNVWGIHSR